MSITSIGWNTNQVIQINKTDMTLIQSTPVEIYRLDTDQFFLDLKDEERTAAGMPWPDTQKNASPTTLGGITYARVLEVIDPYTITFEDDIYVVQLTGSNNNIIEKTNPNQVSIQGNNAAGLIQVPEIQYSAYQNAVTIDVVNGTAGQAYPIGTKESPVDNLTDALFIANLRGFDTLDIIGNFTFPTSPAVDNLVIRGQSASKSTFTLTAAALITNCIFEDATIDGELDGGNDIVNCIVGNLNYIDGLVVDSLLTGDIVLNGTLAEFINCSSGVAGGAQTAVLDLGGGGADLIVRNYNGGLTLENYTTGTDDVSIDMASGQVIMDSTISAGTFTVRGVAKLVDNSTGTAVVVNELLESATVNDTNTVVNATDAKVDILDTNVDTSLVNQTNIESKVDIIDTNVDTALVNQTNIEGKIDTLPDAAANAGAVWDEPLTGHDTAGTFGEWVQKKLLTVAKFIGLSG